MSSQEKQYILSSPSSYFPSKIAPNNYSFTQVPIGPQSTNNPTNHPQVHSNYPTTSGP